ncbi:MAG: SDR family oxidoreductase [Verrucomicrobiota bacterium]
MNTILITGASRGIGLGFAEHYLKAGCRVIAAVRNPQAQTVQALQASYPEMLFVMILDTSDPQSIESFSSDLISGEKPLDLVVNNAAISWEQNYPEWDWQGMEEHFRVNTIGPALIAQAVMPQMSEGSVLVNMTSGMASLEININAHNGFDAYAASKAALNLLTRRLAEKVREQGITVTAVSPGWVQTDMGGAGATTPLNEAVLQLTGLFGKLTLEHSGQFLSESGTSLPW